jgi:hypothetical protein
MLDASVGGPLALSRIVPEEHRPRTSVVRRRASPAAPLRSCVKACIELPAWARARCACCRFQKPHSCWCVARVLCCPAWMIASGYQNYDILVLLALLAGRLGTLQEIVYVSICTGVQFSSWILPPAHIKMIEYTVGTNRNQVVF